MAKITAETIKKIKEKGLMGTIKAVSVRIHCGINVALFYVCKIFRVSDEYIVFESEGDLCDNAYALYEYMRRNNYFKKYKAIWLVDAPKAYQGYENTIFVKKYPTNISPKRAYYLSICKYYVYDHCNVMSSLKKRKNQQIVYLSHGLGFKKGKGVDLTKVKSNFDIMVATGEITAVGLSEYWETPIEKTRNLGYSRLDYFFEDLSQQRKIVNDNFEINKYKKVLLWMPTFRKSINKSLSEDYLDESETGLPLLETKYLLGNWNEYLKNKNMLCVLKVHHLQADLPVFNDTYSNILILKDEDLKEIGIQLYQFIAMTDVLITDYSSISVDYMLLDRPIIYTLDDYELYNKSRGIYPENAMDLMVGYHVFEAGELYACIDEIDKGVDLYKEKRESVVGKFHAYVDGNASKRIVEYLELSVDESV